MLFGDKRVVLEGVALYVNIKNGKSLADNSLIPVMEGTVVTMHVHE